MIIFYNVFLDNVINLFESILLISRFLGFFVGKVLVANEKSRRNYLYLTDNVNIFVKTFQIRLKKFSNESRFLLLRSALPDSRLKNSL